VPEACNDVVLRREVDAVFRGHAEFLNGVKVDLEVTTYPGGRIDYRFLQRPQARVAGANGGSPLQTIEARLNELETLIAELETEIARLTQLCLRAGVDVRSPSTATDIPLPENSDGIPEDLIEEGPPAEDELWEPADEEPPRFTWRSYERIQKAMSLAEVVNVLGDPGHPISRSHFDNAENEVFVWTNPDDSHICVVFRNKAVLVKTQFGLPESDALLKAGNSGL
jgi:hypothetical protein